MLNMTNKGPDKQPDEMAAKESIINSVSLNMQEDMHPVSPDHLKIFVSTFCDRQATDIRSMITSSIELFKYCAPSRGAILVFYAELISEYSTYYWILKKRSMASNNSILEGKSYHNRGRIDYVGELTRKFFQFAKLKLVDEREDQSSESETVSSQILSPTKSITTSIMVGPASPTGSSQACISPSIKSSQPVHGPKMIPVNRKTSSNSASETVDQTPISPSTQDNPCDDVADMDEEVDQNDSTLSVDIFSELKILMDDIKSALLGLIIKNQATSIRSRKGRYDLRSILSEWATEQLISLNIKHSQISQQVANELSRSNSASLIAGQIDLCMENSANRMLIEILLISLDDFKNLFSRLMSSQQNCDWLLAYILLEMSKRSECTSEFASSIKLLIGSQSNLNSLTYILAYLSDTNPKAMTNFPKSNILFLISLCQSSISLLNVLAVEIPDKINPVFLNNLAREVYSNTTSNNHSTCIESLTHCVIAAPNSYKLFLLAFDVMISDEVTPEVKSAAQLIIDSILLKIHERAIQERIQTIVHNPHLHLIDGLLNQINSDLSKLIQKSTFSKYVSNKASAIFYRMSLIFGPSFASRIICHYLNLPEEDYWPLLKPNLTRFMKIFADEGSTLVSQTLSIDNNLKKPVYWININSLVLKCPNLILDLDSIGQLLSDKLCAANFDLNLTAQLIKLCCSSLQRVDQARIRVGTKHRLAKALTTCYFLLLENETDDFQEVLSYIKISLTCMYLLKQSPVASHILCRALLERSLVYGHLFNKHFNTDSSHMLSKADCRICDEASVKLSRENLKVSLGHRFRPLPYHARTNSLDDSKTTNISHVPGKSVDLENGSDSDKPDRQSINSYLLIEAFRSSINSIDAFANLFVEFHCPVMFDKHLWPSDEALRVINEKNLAILRKFDQVPPFWDLFEFIGQSKCLKNCLVLVKALLAAHLALWASATTKASPEKMTSTSRLIPPLAQSGLIPRAFGHTVEVFQHLSSNEVFSVLSDIWQYLKDTHTSNETIEPELTPEHEQIKAKVYLNRLRLFMCQHMPGPTYVKIFKHFYKPTPKTIPA